ncbi:hypothetical protein AB4Y96_08170 [Phyllobacterium sp. TAF24]|uniref:hypothetical protein n=1 Tax=Phyllobacterium sp. TAF24 TaxID=3233068 RepID=UPI003F9E901E
MNALARRNKFRSHNQLSVVSKQKDNIVLYFPPGFSDAARPPQRDPSDAVSPGLLHGPAIETELKNIETINIDEMITFIFFPPITQIIDIYL